MDKEIAMEIASLKRKREEIKKLHVSVDTGVKGLIFILFTSKKEDPVKAAEFMIDQLCPEDGINFTILIDQKYSFIYLISIFKIRIFKIKYICSFFPFSFALCFRTTKKSKKY